MCCRKCFFSRSLLVSSITNVQNQKNSLSLCAFVVACACVCIEKDDHSFGLTVLSEHYTHTHNSRNTHFQLSELNCEPGHGKKNRIHFDKSNCCGAEERRQFMNSVRTTERSDEQTNKINNPTSTSTSNDFLAILSSLFCVINVCSITIIPFCMVTLCLCVFLINLFFFLLRCVVFLGSHKIVNHRYQLGSPKPSASKEI